VSDIDSQTTFTQAEVECSKENGQLAKVTTCYEFYALGRDLWWVRQDVNSLYWMGYYDTGGTSGVV
jgi:hypothetical protein